MCASWTGNLVTTSGLQADVYLVYYDISSPNTSRKQVCIACLENHLALI